MASKAILSPGMPGGQRVHSGGGMAGYTLLFGRELPVCEVPWYSRVVLARSRKHCQEQNDGERQSYENKI